MCARFEDSVHSSPVTGRHAEPLVFSGEGEAGRGSGNRRAGLPLRVRGFALRPEDGTETLFVLVCFRPAGGTRREEGDSLWETSWIRGATLIVTRATAASRVPSKGRM